MLAASWRLGVELGSIAPDAAMLDRYGQYRVASGMWNCARRPADPSAIAIHSPESNVPLFAHQPAMQGPEPEDAAFTNAPQGITSLLYAPVWQGLMPALKRLTTMQTPFQRALRRRVLDLVSDPDYEETLDLEGLARQFHLPMPAAKAALKQLLGDAKRWAEMADSGDGSLAR